MARASFILLLLLPTMHCIVRLKLGQEENKESDPRGKERNERREEFPHCNQELQVRILNRFFFSVSDVRGFLFPFFIYLFILQAL